MRLRVPYDTMPRMPSASDPSTIGRRRAVILALTLLVSFAYFYEGGGWNQNTRFDLVRAILENRTVRIDLYHENTGDKSHVGTHFYMDKAPGASLTAVPAVGLVRAVMRAAHGRLYSPQAMVVFSYVATIAAAAVPAALAAWCVFWSARRFGADDAGATLAAVVCGLGTPLWAYATLFYGHALAAGCLAAAYLGALRFGDPLESREAAGLGVLIGLAAGWALVTEYPASIPGGIIVLYAAWLRWRRDRSSLGRTSVAVGAGLGFGAIVLLGYNWLAFGRPLYIGYTSEEGYEAMRTGVFGVSLPSPHAAYEILFGAYRGLLPLAPVLAITPLGFWFLLREARTRSDAAIAGIVALYYFLLTAGYAYWSGGWSVRLAASRPRAAVPVPRPRTHLDAHGTPAPRRHPRRRSDRRRRVARRRVDDAAAAGRRGAAHGGVALAGVRIRRLSDRMAGISGLPSAARCHERARSRGGAPRVLECGSDRRAERLREPAAPGIDLDPCRRRLAPGWPARLRCFVCLDSLLSAK